MMIGATVLVMPNLSLDPSAVNLETVPVRVILSSAYCSG